MSRRTTMEFVGAQRRAYAELREKHKRCACGQCEDILGCHVIAEIKNGLYGRDLVTVKAAESA